MKKKRAAKEYILESIPDEQVTPMSDDWYVVHHTSMPNNHWWAVRHQCEDGLIYGMPFHPGHTNCNGCKIPLPIAIEGFINMMEWER